MKTLNVGRMNVRTYDRARLFAAKGDQILVEVVEARRRWDRFYPRTIGARHHPVEKILSMSVLRRPTAIGL